MSFDRGARLKQWALEAGFDRAGVASLEPSEYGEALQSWLARGDQAGMAYLERRVEMRLEPARLLEGARSALCVALHYAPLRGDQPGCQGDLWPKVARYARGDDYHEMMQKRLDLLAARVEQAFPGCRTRRYVDTGPILERELAQRAGLGRIGKNTNLLNRKGSWFLLGELLLTLELEPDQPIGDLCGSCTLCLEACPTGALPAPYRLDSRRCISYWTIEHRGAVPEEARGWMEDWVFGCDICQEVCPWNSHLSRRPDTAGLAWDHPELEIPERRRALGLCDLLELGRESYVELFRKSPMKRAKLEGLQRNAALALASSDGESLDPTTLAPVPVPGSVQALIRVLRDGEPLVRRHAAWTLGRLGGEVSGQALRDALAKEPEPAVRSEMLAAIHATQLLSH